MIPLFHDFTGETVLVFGGGPVGARKARRFASEASVVVVSPAFADRDFGDAERVRAAPDSDGVAAWVERAEPGLVVAATDQEDLNEAAADAARATGALCNRADRHGERAVDDVVVPATVRDDPVTIAVSTDGTSPALSRYLRERIESEVEGAGAMAELTGELRETLKSEGMAADERRAALRRVVSSARVWKALDSGGSNARHIATDVICNNTGDHP
jgi:precorrin-2 dehydrogenase/sirohydrochlorin ferrochelatase